MERMLSNKTVSLTELRDPAKVLRNAGDSPVAVLNRNKVVGYFVPKSAVDKVSYEFSTLQEVQKILKESMHENADILEYLKDK